MLDQHRILWDFGSELTQNTPSPRPRMELFIEDLGTFDLSSHRIQCTPHPTKIGTSHEGLYVVERCMETTAVPEEDKNLTTK